MLDRLGYRWILSNQCQQSRSRHKRLPHFPCRARPPTPLLPDFHMHLPHVPVQGTQAPVGDMEHGCGEEMVLRLARSCRRTLYQLHRDPGPFLFFVLFRTLLKGLADPLSIPYDRAVPRIRRASFNDRGILLWPRHASTVPRDCDIHSLLAWSVHTSDCRVG